jgi:hypothetical protein
VYLDSPEGAKWPHPADKEYPALLKKLFVTHCKHFEPSLKGQCASNTKQTKKKQPNLAPKSQLYKSKWIYNCQKISTRRIGDIILPKEIMKTSSENYNSLFCIFLARSF